MIILENNTYKYSDDNGATWQTFSWPMESPNVNKLSGIRLSRGVYTLYDMNKGIYNSVDGGATWAQNENTFDSSDRFDGHISSNDYITNDPYETADTITYNSDGYYQAIRFNGETKSKRNIICWIKEDNGALYMYGGPACSYKGEVMYGLKYSLDGGLTWSRVCDQSKRYVDVNNGVALRSDGSTEIIGGFDMEKYLGETGAQTIIDTVTAATGDTTQLETTATDLVGAVNELYDAIQEITNE